MPKNNHYAYGPERAGVEAIMRFGAVKRWHMIETTGTQTLADHSACVAGLAFLIAKTCPETYFGDAANVVPYALFHDIPEVFMGDIPTHTKQKLDRLTIFAIECELVPPALNVNGFDPVALMVKLCDLADGIRFIRNRGVDTTGKHALQGLERQFEAKAQEARARWPDMVYSHTLDMVHFYAYETARNDSQGTDSEGDVRSLEADVARGSGNQPGSAGPELRDAHKRGEASRNRVDRVEGNEGNTPCPPKKVLRDPPVFRSSTAAD